MSGAPDDVVEEVPVRVIRINGRWSVLKDVDRIGKSRYSPEGKRNEASKKSRATGRPARIPARIPR